MQDGADARTQPDVIWDEENNSDNFASSCSLGSERERKVMKELTQTSIQAVARDPDPKARRKRAETVSKFRKFLGSGSLLHWVEWWINLREPEPSGCFATWVDSQSFEIMSLCVILGNAACTVLDTNSNMNNLTLRSNATPTWYELTFTCFFACELALKLWVHRLYFFVNSDWAWNIGDAVLVFLSLLASMENLLGRELQQPGFLRFVRLARISRVLRIVRLLNFFHELRLMIHCVVGSFLALFWAIFLVFSFSLLFAIILVQSMTTFLVEQPAISGDLLVKIQQTFGSVEKASLTLCHTISGGDWMTTYEIIAPTGWVNVLIFLSYFVIVWLSVTNIITCIFIDKAMKLAQPSTEELLFDKHKDNMATAQEMEKLYADIVEGTADGLIGWPDLEVALEDQRIATHMEIMGLEVNDASMFFHMLCSIAGKDRIDVGTFIWGCLKMKGYAMNIDLVQLNYEIRIISKHQQKLIHQLCEDVHHLCNAKRSSP